MKRRKQRKNPVGLVLPIVAALAAAGGVAFLVTRPSNGPQVLPNGMTFDPKEPLPFTGFDDANFAGLIASDILIVDTSRFPVPGIGSGGAVFQAVSGPNMSTHTIMAKSIDNRFRDSTPRAIPQGALSGASPAAA